MSQDQTMYMTGKLSDRGDGETHGRYRKVPILSESSYFFRRSTRLLLWPISDNIEIFLRFSDVSLLLISEHFDNIEKFLQFSDGSPFPISEIFDDVEKFLQFSDELPLLISEILDNVENFLPFSNGSTCTDIGKFRRYGKLHTIFRWIPITDIGKFRKYRKLSFFLRSV